jgi:excisionase family DNA binding protein
LLQQRSEPVTKPKTLTVKSACEYADIGETLLYTLIRSNAVASIVLGRRRLIFVDSLDAYLDRLHEEQKGFHAQPVPWATDRERRGRTIT